LKTPGFVAPWWLINGHAQTIYGSLFSRTPPVAFRRERWDTPDGDFVDVDFVDGPQGTPWVHLFHGLEGSSRSHYAAALMSAVSANCGPKLPSWRGRRQARADE